MNDSAPADERPTAAMVTIGDEILSGRILDTNAQKLATMLAGLGVRLREIRVVPDETAAIVAAVNALRASHTYVFTSGGIGPTHDDITVDAVAAAFGASIDVRADARAILEAYYGAADLNAARLRMARIPEGATLIDNPISRAPGFRLGNVHVMAGVPIVFEQMLASVAPTLAGGPPTLAWSLRAATPEGDIAEALGRLAAAHPTVAIGCYPFHRGGFGATLVLRATDLAALSAAADGARTLLTEALTARGAPADIAETPPETA